MKFGAHQTRIDSEEKGVRYVQLVIENRQKSALECSDIHNRHFRYVSPHAVVDRAVV